jgi:hypothetical protein
MQIVCKTLSRKNHSRNRAGGVAQGVGPEFKLQFQQQQQKIVTAFLEFIDQFISSKTRPLNNLI